jgi:hypothetical protein
MGMDGVVVREPGGNLLEDGDGIRTRFTRAYSRLNIFTKASQTRCSPD